MPTAGSLTNLLSNADRDQFEASANALIDELNNDSIALRLGRAFLTGRLVKLREPNKIYGPDEPYPFPTSEECDLFAFGFRYDEGPSEHPLAQDLEQAAEVIEKLSRLDQEEQAVGLSLELINRRLDLRTGMINRTVGNIIERVEKLDSNLGIIAEVVKELTDERRPYATGRPEKED
jgi:hypothetical protein